MIKAVLFDFGGVLTEAGKKGFILTTIANLLGRPEKQVDIGDLHHAMRRGKSTEAAFFGDINKRYGARLNKELFLANIRGFTKPSEPVYELAERLRAQGIKTGILSNVFGMSARDLQDRGFYEGFDPLVLSCDEGYAKPDPEFYGIGIRKTGVKAEEILFVDDQDKCLPEALAQGMHVIKAASPQQIVADVTAFIREHNHIDL
jgi:putative hydrolase of the HAD superfamily